MWELLNDLRPLHICATKFAFNSGIIYYFRFVVHLILLTLMQKSLKFKAVLSDIVTRSAIQAKRRCTMDVGSVQDTVQLTVLRRTLDMAASQAEHLLQGLETALPSGVGETVDVRV